MVTFVNVIVVVFVPVGKLVMFPLKKAETVTLPPAPSEPLAADKETQLLGQVACQLIVVVPKLAIEYVCVEATEQPVCPLEKSPSNGPTERFGGPDGKVSPPTGAKAMPRQDTLIAEVLRILPFASPLAAPW